MITLIECPRDAMQGIKHFIPTSQKIEYLNRLLKIGFDTLDFGSFVSPKAIPQMADTQEVLEKLDESKTQLLAIIANLRGAEQACKFSRISFLGYPFSISETFQLRNTNSSIADSLKNVNEMNELCEKHKKKLVVYLSMAFGNPYGDEWSKDIALEWCSKLAEVGVKTIALSDTVGVSNPQNINEIFSLLQKNLPETELGAHLHTTPDTWEEKISAAYYAGCRRFDGALGGYGGCPMAKDELTGNMPTEKMVQWLLKTKENLEIDIEKLEEAAIYSGHLMN
ncbi:hydroxymethylglutaryl-CoA lyase [Flavobacteriales bacterium]|nr:Hydroxymethylglutaryl-CoA lyase YngG [Flavobacteriales bacterium]MCL4816951.1 hydroxymethylglutaryl-CoA lyase [Flavobacteriales bacterium]WKZ76011.1 MAG: hydroxymethylglutaryl-CoA lyase [Vicingaceae bacterium]GIK70452.1 MAG: hydroxymethylglutaryl-CoA lyase [Bacteroidota bacterium]CAG0980815.1 hydroxymethylglutaryl-CoA lyase [Flavobacteriales bacterium]